MCFRTSSWYHRRIKTESKSFSQKVFVIALSNSTHPVTSPSFLPSHDVVVLNATCRYLHEIHGVYKLHITALLPNTCCMFSDFYICCYMVLEFCIVGQQSACKFSTFQLHSVCVYFCDSIFISVQAMIKLCIFYLYCCVNVIAFTLYCSITADSLK